MKKILSLILLILILTLPLFSQSDYPEISQEELEQSSYIVFEETNEFQVVIVDGVYYIYYL
jgi:hypothetical protein